MNVRSVTDHKRKGCLHPVATATKKDNRSRSATTPKETRSPTRRAVWSKIGNPGVLRDGFVEIEKGVRTGDWVVVSGMQRLKNDKMVKAEKYAGRRSGRAMATSKDSRIDRPPYRLEHAHSAGSARLTE